jgi:hypothetical protein
VNRREAIQTIGLLLGAAVTPSVARAFDAGYAPPLTGPLRTLTPDEAELVATLGELIIPTTDTPGARDAGIAFFIDSLMTDVFGEEERKRFRAGLADVDTRAKTAGASAFVQLAAHGQSDLLTAMSAELKATADRNGPRPFFSWMKELTLLGYYTSEIGATKELKTVMIPGRYDGDVPYSQVGRAYA